MLVGRCPPYGEGITFWPLRELLAAGRAAPTDELTGLEPRGLRRGPPHARGARPRAPARRRLRRRPLGRADVPRLRRVPRGRLGDARVLVLCLARPQLAEQRPAWLQPPGRGARARAALRGRLAAAARGARRAGSRCARGSPRPPRATRSSSSSSRRAPRRAPEARCRARSAASSTSGSTGSTARSARCSSARPWPAAASRSRRCSSSRRRRRASSVQARLLALDAQALRPAGSDRAGRGLPLPPRADPRRGLRRHPEERARRAPRARRAAGSTSARRRRRARRLPPRAGVRRSARELGRAGLPSSAPGRAGCSARPGAEAFGRSDLPATISLFERAVRAARRTRRAAAPARARPGAVRGRQVRGGRRGARRAIERGRRRLACSSRAPASSSSSSRLQAESAGQTAEARRRPREALARLRAARRRPRPLPRAGACEAWIEWTEGQATRGGRGLAARSGARPRGRRGARALRDPRLARLGRASGPTPVAEGIETCTRSCEQVAQQPGRRRRDAASARGAPRDARRVRRGARR